MRGTAWIVCLVGGWVGWWAGTAWCAGGVACWRGPDGSGAMGDAGLALVEDLSKARLLWKSEDRGCSIGYGADGIGRDGYVNFRSGYASPVGAEGRVYFVYFVPTGWDPAPGKEFTDADKARARELAQSVVGDDVIVCADAATGKTVWRKVFAGTSIHWKGLSKYGTHITPCVADGKVFALGSCGAVYCLDARTGRLLWDGTVGSAAAKHKAGRDAGQLPGGRYHFSSSPTYAEGVAVFNDHAGSLLGLDAASGKELWRTGGAGSCTSATRWPCKERTYVVAHGRCLDPRTGKVLWKADCGQVDGAGGSYAVSEEYMLTGGGHTPRARKTADENEKATANETPKAAPAKVAAAAPASRGGVTCFRIDERGATRLWALEDGFRTGHSSPMIYHGYGYFQTGTELVCVEMKTGAIVAKEAVTNSNPCQAPIAVDGRVIMMARAGVLMFSEGDKGMKPLGAALAPPRESTITPYVAEGRLLFRGPNYLWAYDLRK